ncbi:unnamed protein product [Sphagnum jensenii]|uniref:Uncharacterized protein n=1 Tax=Sphagnum jensenii TaxID=128206 RepID=A0ABP0XLF7_9BRYO
MHTLRMIGRNCVEGGRSMQFCVKRAGFVFSRVLFRNRFVNFNLEGGGTSMHFARTEVEPFSCVSCFVIGLLTAIWKEMKYREEEFSKGGCRRDLLNVAPT